MQTIKCYLGCHCNHIRIMSGTDKDRTQLQFFFLLIVYKIIRVLDVASKTVGKGGNCSAVAVRELFQLEAGRGDRGDLDVSVDTHWGATKTSLEISSGNYSSGSDSHLCFIVKYLIGRLIYCKHIPLLEEKNNCDKNLCSWECGKIGTPHFCFWNTWQYQSTLQVRILFDSEVQFIGMFNITNLVHIQNNMCFVYNS